MKKIYCDGACAGNPGPGGWGVVVVKNEKHGDLELYSSDPDTTNNQMELTAAIMACEFVALGESVEIFTDSKYVIQGITEWIHGWKKNGWKTTKKQPVKNGELWQSLDRMRNGKNITWTWVKGHNNDPYNTIADKLACLGKSGKSNLNTLSSLLQLCGGKEEKKEMVTKVKEPFVVEQLSFISNDQTDEIFVVVDARLKMFGNDTKIIKIVQLSGEISEYLITYKQLQEDFSLQQNVVKKVRQNLFHYLKDDSNSYGKLFYRAKDKCEHNIVGKIDSYAKCDICQENFGWFCPQSPDHVCHYYTDNETGLIVLRNGDTVKPAPDHDSRYETHDECLFCGSPDERR